MKRAFSGLMLLAALAIATDADAQKRRLPVRTDEVPDTESGRPAASAEKPTFKGRMIIYGPPELPLGAPPEHIKSAPQTEPVAEPKSEPGQAPSAAPIASPAPVVVPPTPVATPAPTPLPAQIAVPAPTPTPPPVQIAVPAPIAPTPPPAPVVVVPVPPPPAPTPVAVPLPTPTPPAPVAVPIPVAPPVRIAAPAPAPTPAAAAAASALREPVVREPIVREPVVRSEPARSEPARPAAPAAPPRQEVALAAPSSAPAAPVPIETKLIESVFNCLSPGLPPDWKRAWVEITDQGDGKEKNSKFRVSNIRDVDDEGEPLEPCNAQELTRRIVGLNDKLPLDRRAWTRALLIIDSDGEYELTYEYAKK